VPCPHQPPLLPPTPPPRPSTPQLVFAKDGSYAQELLVEELVAATDAMSREALSEALRLVGAQPPGGGHVVLCCAVLCCAALQALGCRMVTWVHGVHGEV
jgi:hypothetical protein